MEQTGTAARFFNEPVADIIRRRRSVRTYNEGGLKKEDRDRLVAGFDTLESPFGTKIRYVFLEKSAALQDGGAKIGTYGLVRGAKSFIAPVICGYGDIDSNRALMDIGYCFEKLVLYATSIGIGTCWIGGNFSRAGFAKAVGLGKGEKLTVVSPVGYTAEKRSMIENIMYRGAGANKRKEWAKLFFDGSFDKGLDKHEAGDYELPLEMLRKGPSASNIQPWRVIRTKGYYHFFLEGTIGYGKALGFNIQKIDIGIALCHFELVSLEAGLKGQWEFLKGKGINSAMIDSVSRPGMEYMVSWKCAEE